MAGECELCGEKVCKCEKAIKVSFCPKCRSQDVKYVFGVGNLFGILPKMRCGKCGNESSTFPLLVTSKKMLAASEAAAKKVTKKVKKVTKKVTRKIKKGAKK